MKKIYQLAKLCLMLRGSYEETHKEFGQSWSNNMVYTSKPTCHSLQTTNKFSTKDWRKSKKLVFTLHQKQVVILAANLSLIKTEEYEFSNYQRENILKMFVVSEISTETNLNGKRRMRQEGKKLFTQPKAHKTQTQEIRQNDKAWEIRTRNTAFNSLNKLPSFWLGFL